MRTIVSLNHWKILIICFFFFFVFFFSDPIQYAGQCGDYFLVPPNSTFRMSVNFGVHHQDLGDLYCVLTFMADGGTGRKFCVNFTHINLREDSFIYIFEGENMEFPELYKHIIKVSTNLDFKKMFGKIIQKKKNKDKNISIYF